MPSPTDEPTRITGPLRTWYDLHEALDHEAAGLAEDAASLSAEHLDAFAERFWGFDRELRAHSEVEDGIMFPAITARGGHVDAELEREHRAEQLEVYALGSLILHALAATDADALAALAAPAVALRDSLRAHLRAEEATVLNQVDVLFDDQEQGALLRTIIGALPPDPQLQPWVSAAITPEHLEARLRNIANSLSTPALTALLTQIRDGVDAETWHEVEARTPELAALVTTGSRSPA